MSGSATPATLDANETQKTSQNASDVASFARRVEALKEMLERATEMIKDDSGGGGSIPQSMQTRMERMSK